MYFIIHSFNALSLLRMFAMMSHDAVYRSIGVRQAVIRPRPNYLYTCKNSFLWKLDVDTLAEF